MRKEEFNGSILVYSTHLDDIEEVLNEVHKHNIGVTIENCEICVSNLEGCMLDTIQKDSPNLMLIENDGSCNGLVLYKMIKDEGTLKDIPVVFIGPEVREEKLRALKLGALDYISKPLDKEELTIKLLNYVELSKTFLTNHVYDTLTNVYSRKYGEEAAKSEFKSAKLSKNSFTVLAFDMDNMSTLNFYLGKATGDKILQECSDILKKRSGTLDFIYRLSGERFVVVFPNKLLEEVLTLANSILKEVETLTVKYNMKISFTGAVGVLNLSTLEYEDLIHSVIECLENAKLKEKGMIYTADNTVIEIAKPRLLIVNEDNVILSILGSRYRSKGYEVFTVDDIDIALKLAGDNKIDVIVTDYMLSGIAGIELIKKLKAINNESKIMILSSQKSEYVVETALSNGADDYVVKPFSPVELDSRIKKLLG
jgi:two-component system, cell cycle response regulator